MSRDAPWDDIKEPRADYNTRRVAITEGIPLYWGKDIRGQCLLIIELQGDHSTQFRRDTVSLHGIDVDLRNGEGTQQQRLVLTLERHVDRDLFSSLCEALVASLAPVTDSAVALATALAHLKRWKAFLAGRKARVLSGEEVRGLFAELHVLRKLYQSALTQEAAVDAWCGPDDSHQDFIFGNTAVEVKSLSGRERNVVRISSEDQLEGLSDNLFLLIVRLSDMPESELAQSLNGMVRNVEQELTQADAIEQFSAKLADCGYAPLTDYDVPCFLVNGTQSYRVGAKFPRLIRSQLSQGLSRVSYDIRLEAMTPFECDNNNIFRRL